MRKSSVTLVLIPAALTLGVLAVGNQITRAAEISLPVTAGAVISDSTEHRILVKFAIPDSLAAYRVLLAVCEVELSSLACGGRLPSFQAAPVTNAWSPSSVRWEGDWSADGGDYELAGSADVTVEHDGSPRASFAITEWLQSTSKGRKTNHGFILYPTDGRDYGCEAVALTEGFSGRVRVVFTR